VAREAKVIYTAEDRTGPATASAKAGLMSVKEAAAIAGFQLASLGSAATLAGIVAMVKKAAEGVDALNDIRDATGATIENISALERVQMQYGHAQGTATTSLIKFNQALQATVKPGSDAEKVIAALGLNAKQLRDMDPAEALRETAIALNRYADDGAKARAVQELFGKSLREVAPFLKDLAESGELVATVTTKQAEEAEKFNRELFKLQGNVTILAREMANPLITTVNEFIQSLRDAQKEGEGFGGTLLRVASVMPTFSNAGGAIGRWLREQFVGPELLNGFTAARKGIEDINEALKEKTLRETERNALLRERVRLEGQLAGYLTGGGGGFKAGVDDPLSWRGGGRGTGGYTFAKTSLELPEQEQKTRKVATAIKEASEAEREWAGYIKDRRKAFLEAHDAEVKARADRERAEEQFRQRLVAADDEAEQKILQRVYQLEQESKTFGMLESQVARVTLARLEDARAAAHSNQESVEGIDRQIAAQQRLIAALEGKELREANQKAADSAAAAWASVGDAFVDNLMRGGKSVAQYLKDLFRTLVLRPILAPIGQAVSGVIGSMFGSTASAATGGGSNVLGSIGSVAGIAGSLGTFGAGLSAGFGGLTGSIGGLFGMAGTGATLGGAISAGTTALAAGNIVGGLGTLAGALGPIALGIAALVSFVKSRGETRAGGQYVNGVFVDGPSGGQIASKEVQQLVGTTMSSINETLRLLGSDARLTKLVTGLEQSEKGKGFAYAGGALTTGTVFGQGIDGLGYMNRRGSMTSEQAFTALGEEIKQATIQALQAANVPGILGEYLRSLGDIDALDGGALDAALARVNKALSEKQALEQRIFELTATEAQQLARARELERASIDESNHALLDRIYALEDERIAAERVTEAVEETTAAIDEVAVAMERLANINRRADSYAERFLTPSELQGYRINKIGQSLGRAGIGFTPEQIMAASLQDVRQLFEYMQQLGDLDAQEAILDAIDAFLLLKDAAAGGTQQMEDLARRIQDLGKGVFEYVRDLKATRGGTATSQVTLAQRQSSYYQDLALAQANDVDALGRINQTAQAYIEAQVRHTASSSTTQAVIDRVIGQMSALPAYKSYEQQMLLTLGTISDTLDVTQASTLAKLEAMLTKSEVTQKTMAAILSRLSEDSILSYGKAEVSAIYGAIEFNTRRTAELLAAMGAVGGIKLPGTGTTAPPTTGSGGTTGDTPTDAQKFAEELALYNQMQSTGLSIYAAAAARGWDPATVDAWLARTGLPAFATGGTHRGGARVVGERGWEIEYTGPSRIFNHADSQRLLQGVADGGIERQLAALRDENRLLRDELRGLRIVVAEGASRQIEVQQGIRDNTDGLADQARLAKIQPVAVAR
jgi:hypothetical protein